MSAPDRRTFLWTAGRLALGAGALATRSALGDSLPPVMTPDALKPAEGDGVLALPAGAARRLGDTRMRIPGHINGFRISPKGTTLITATSGELRGWDPKTGKVLFRLGFPNEAWVDSGRLTTDDCLALLVRPNSGSSYESRRYEFGTGKLLTRSPSLTLDSTQHTAFSADGKLLAAVHNEALCLRDAATGAEKWREGLPAQSVGDCQFFHDGATIAVAMRDEVKLFATATGKLTKALRVGHVEEPKKAGANPNGKQKDFVSDLCTSADGKWLAASVGDDADLVFCWDVTTGTLKHRLKPAGKPVGFTRDGSELATSHAGTIAFWSMANGKELRRFDIPTGELYLSPDGKMLAASAGDCLILMDAQTGKPLAHSADPPGVPATLRFVTPDRVQGRLDDWGGWVEWNCQSGTRTLIRPPGVGGLNPIALSADGRVALYRKADQYTARDLATGKVLFTGKGAEDVNDSVTTVAMSPNGRALIAVTATALQVNTETGPRSIARPAGDAGMVSAVATDGRTAAVSFRGSQEKSHIDLYDLASNKHVRRLTVEGDASGLAFGPDGTRLVVAHDAEGDQRHNQRGTASVFDLRTGKAVFHTAPDENHREHVIALSADARMLARLADKGNVNLWEVAAGEVRATIAMGESATVNALAFSPDGRTLAASVHGGPVFLWELYAGPPRPLSAAELDKAWAELHDGKAAVAFEAVKRLVRSPAEAVRYLKKKVVPIAPPDPKEVTRLIGDLDHREFRKREAAVRALAELGERVHESLRQALAAGPSPEARERLERLLATEGKATPEQLRRLRAVEAVELSGSPEADKVLTYWASGAPGAHFTSEAAAAAKRLGAAGR
jgi:WD40 repeat protein